MGESNLSYLRGVCGQIMDMDSFVSRTSCLSPSFCSVPKISLPQVKLLAANESRDTSHGPSFNLNHADFYKKKTSSHPPFWYFFSHSFFLIFPHLLYIRYCNRASIFLFGRVCKLNACPGRLPCRHTGQRICQDFSLPCYMLYNHVEWL